MKPTTRARREFLKGLRELCDELYSLGDSFKPSQKWRESSALATGYIKAGLLMEIVSKDEIEKVIGDCHVNAFGETKSEKRARRNPPVGDGTYDIDWSLFDSPSLQRR